MYIELIIKIFIWCFFVVGIYQVQKVISFKDKENKWKNGWNNFLMLLFLIINVGVLIFLFRDNL